MTVPTEPSGPMLDIASRAPKVFLDEIASGGTVLVVSPHPDDETLGCGMAIAAAIAAGRKVLILLTTDGEASHPGSRSVDQDALRRIRRGELDTALAILSGGPEVPVMALRLPEGRSTPDMIASERFSALVHSLRSRDIRSVWTTWQGDPHIDHRTAAVLAQRLASALEADLWSYPIWGRFLPSAPEIRDLRRFACPSEDLADRKRRALAVYRSQFDCLINDDPDGFMMPPAILAHFASFDEIFIRD
jgi:LmbE family N-acetylglucosaminyl deacetylase